MKEFSLSSFALGFAVCALICNFVIFFGCSETGVYPDDEDTLELFETILVEPLSTGSLEFETVSYDPPTTVSIVEPFDTVEIVPLETVSWTSTDDTREDTGEDTGSVDEDTGEETESEEDDTENDVDTDENNCNCHCHHHGKHHCHKKCHDKCHNNGKNCHDKCKHKHDHKHHGKCH